MFAIIPNWHPFFVHFTVALLAVAAVLYVSMLFINKETLHEQVHTVARWNLWMGAGFAVVTVITGFIAFNSVDHDTLSHLAMKDHRNWALATVLLFVVLASWSFFKSREGQQVSKVMVFGLLAATLVLGSTAWHGGELVYRHGLGVMSLPKLENEGDGHNHNHGNIQKNQGHDTETEAHEATPHSH